MPGRGLDLCGVQLMDKPVSKTVVHRCVKPLNNLRGQEAGGHNDKDPIHQCFCGKRFRLPEEFGK